MKHQRSFDASPVLIEPDMEDDVRQKQQQQQLPPKKRFKRSFTEQNHPKVIHAIAACHSDDEDHDEDGAGRDNVPTSVEFSSSSKSGNVSCCSYQTQSSRSSSLDPHISKEISFATATSILTNSTFTCATAIHSFDSLIAVTKLDHLSALLAMTKPRSVLMAKAATPRLPGTMPPLPMGIPLRAPPPLPRMALGEGITRRKNG